MAHYVSSMIGIRIGGVFFEEADIGDLTKRISKVAKEIKKNGFSVDFNADDPSHCLSKELVAHKGSYVVMAGVFNYWTYDSVSEFAKRLSKEFGTEIMVMTWDEENNNVQCNIFLNGKPLFEIEENPIGKVLRRVF